ncbi:hypothetical protein J2X76_003694 [Neorhizobium sp. 2083]|nr:hypothetical protein [Neorhizobium sp. 2083]MDR6818517.1 hypothetical protein [Neorhizobium sp. 2083]
MKDDRPLDHEDFDEPERKNPFWFIIAGGIVVLATGGALWSSMRMLGIV